MISIIEREIVDKYHWLERDEFLDILAVAQSMPGILAVNISVVVGDKLRGLKGSIMSSLGTIMPSFLIILLIAMFLTPELITSNPTLSAIFKGIRPVVVALIIAPVFTTARSAASAGKQHGYRPPWPCSYGANGRWCRIPFYTSCSARLSGGILQPEAINC